MRGIKGLFERLKGIRLRFGKKKPPGNNLELVEPADYVPLGPMARARQEEEMRKAEVKRIEAQREAGHQALVDFVKAMPEKNPKAFKKMLAAYGEGQYTLSEVAQNFRRVEQLLDMERRLGFEGCGRLVFLFKSEGDRRYNWDSNYARALRSFSRPLLKLLSDADVQRLAMCPGLKNVVAHIYTDLHYRARVDNARGVSDILSKVGYFREGFWRLASKSPEGEPRTRGLKANVLGELLLRLSGEELEILSNQIPRPVIDALNRVKIDSVAGVALKKFVSPGRKRNNKQKTESVELHGSWH